MNTSRPPLVRSSRREYALRLAASLLVWFQHRLARRHLARGEPQLAILAFDHIGIRINAFGRYEREELDALAAFLRSRALVRGACIDVGANIGNHSIFLSRIFDQVHAIEPGRLTFALLRSNASARSNITCHNVGLSDANKDAFWSAPAENIGEGRVLDIATPGAGYSTGVKLVRLDDYLPLQGFEVGLLKIDVEGHEAAVLDGGSETIARCSPVVLIEQHENEIDKGTSPSIERLRSLGYRSFFVLRRSPSPGSRILAILCRLVAGESIDFHQVEKFEKRFYSMILATK